jgi:hypothetical protein
LISARSPGEQVAKSGHSQALIGADATVSQPDEALPLSAECFIVRRPKHAKSEFTGGPKGEIEEFVASTRRYGDKDSRAMDKGTRQRCPPLCGRNKSPGELIFEVRDTAEVEDLESSLPCARRIYAADTEERHGNILGYRKGRQQTRILEKKSEVFIAQAPAIFLRDITHSLSLEQDCSGVRGFEKTEVVELKVPASAVRTVKLTERGQREGKRNVADEGLTALIPVHSMTAKGLAGENWMHAKKKCSASRRIACKSTPRRQESILLRLHRGSRE